MLQLQLHKIVLLDIFCNFLFSAQPMKMDSALEAQQETAVTETESQQITQAQIATLAQVLSANIAENSFYVCNLCLWKALPLVLVH